MWADPTYLRSWRDLRRREILFWFFVLSYIPGILLIIVIVNVFENDVPEHIGMYFSAAWLAGFAGTGFYRQNFQCPRLSPVFLSSLHACRPTCSKLRELQPSLLGARSMNAIIAFSLRMRAL